MNDITVYLNNGDSIQAESVYKDIIVIISGDPSYAGALMTMAKNGDFDGYEADTPEGHVKAPLDNRFLGLSATVNDDGDYNYVISFVPKSDEDILREQIAELIEENERLKGDSEYAEAGRILLGEEEET